MFLGLLQGSYSFSRKEGIVKSFSLCVCVHTRAHVCVLLCIGELYGHTHILYEFTFLDRSNYLSSLSCLFKALFLSQRR